MSDTLSRSDVEDLLYREAMLIDQGAWDDWLALYSHDAVFWVPAWRDEQTLTNDPDCELSLIYYRGRRNLEDRVWRLRSGQSVASTPLARVIHAVTNVVIESQIAGDILVTAAFAVHRYDVRSERTHVFFGRYHYRLRPADGVWLIAEKRVHLLNDNIPTVLDFYCV